MNIPIDQYADDKNIAAFLDYIPRLLRLARFGMTCCDGPGDLMYHGTDGTWWRRVDDRLLGPQWIAADPPARRETDHD